MREDRGQSTDTLYQPGIRKSLYAFEAQMRRRAGHDDGIVNAMFKISQPVTGAYFWCPPMRAGRLDPRRLGLGA